MKISLAHSPDADDAFMFYAMAKNKIDLKGYDFEHVLCDIQTLSQKALEEQAYDITAISYHAYPLLQQHYELMRCGSSMGDNYGPILIAAEGSDTAAIIDSIKAGTCKVAVPGLLTSAYLSLKFWAPNASCEAHDFKAIQGLVQNGKYQAGLIIHEGQVTVEQEPFVVLVDLGQWWYQESNGLPLPLGANVMRRDLPDSVKQDLSLILKESIAYALDHREEALEHALQYSRGLANDKADKFVGMYVNELTLDLGSRGEQAVKLFYEKAQAFVDMDLSTVRI